MNIQKLHYENLVGMLIRREGLLNWRCPLCRAEGQSPEVMRACPECGSKEATLSGAQPAPSAPDGWKLVPTAESRHPGIYKMLGALHAIDNTRGASEWESYAAMLAAAPKPEGK